MYHKEYLKCKNKDLRKKKKTAVTSGSWSNKDMREKRFVSLFFPLYFPSFTHTIFAISFTYILLKLVRDQTSISNEVWKS